MDLRRLQVGYPCKLKYQDFVNKYRCIAFDKPALIDAKLDAKTITDNLLQLFGELAAWRANFDLQVPRRSAGCRCGTISLWRLGVSVLEQWRGSSYIHIHSNVPFKRAVQMCTQTCVRLLQGGRVQALHATGGDRGDGCAAQARASQGCHGSGCRCAPEGWWEGDRILAPPSSLARALQLCLRSESGEKVPRKAEEVREHLADAEYKVEELSVVWKSALNPKLALALRRCAMQRQELISEWKLQSKMLNGEVEAAAKVMAVLEQKPELTKEAFLHLKTVTAEYGHATQTCG